MVYYSEPELIHIQQFMFCALEKGQVIQCQIELSNPELEGGAGGQGTRLSNRKLCGASRGARLHLVA